MRAEHRRVARQAVVQPAQVPVHPLEQVLEAQLDRVPAHLLEPVMEIQQELARVQAAEIQRTQAWVIQVVLEQEITSLLL